LLLLPAPCQVAPRSTHFHSTRLSISSLWLFCRGRLHDPRQGEFGGYALADKGGGCAKAGVGGAELLASGITFPPPVVRSCASRSYGSSARSRTWLFLGLRPAARLSARRQRSALHNPLTLLLPMRHGTRGRIALGCCSRAMRSCGSSARSCSRTRPGLRRVCGISALVRLVPCNDVYMMCTGVRYRSIPIDHHGIYM